MAPPIAARCPLPASANLSSSLTMTRTPCPPPACTPASPACSPACSHLSRVLRYTRPSDWAYGAAVGALSPGLMLYWERVSPSFVGKGGFAPVMRLSGAVGIAGALLFACSRSTCALRPLHHIPQPY
jgi:hypothetical protein